MPLNSKEFRGMLGDLVPHHPIRPRTDLGRVDGSGLFVDCENVEGLLGDRAFHSLVIQFGQGGGTYNAKTGEATNVAGVQHTDTHHQKTDSTAFYRSQYEEMVHTADSLSQQCSDYSRQLDEERKKARSGYDRFCSWWFWITFVLLLGVVAFWVCDKIPACKPYTTAIKLFLRI